MASKSDNDASAKRARTATKNARVDLEDFKKKSREKLRKLRDAKVPNAMLNVGVSATTGIATGAARGLVPEEITIMKRQVPVGLIADGTGVLAGTVIAGGSAMMGSEIGIHAGGGIATVSAAGIARKLTQWAREESMKWWNDRNKTGNGQGAGTGAQQQAA